MGRHNDARLAFVVMRLRANRFGELFRYGSAGRTVEVWSPTIRSALEVTAGRRYGYRINVGAHPSSCSSSSETCALVALSPDYSTRSWPTIHREGLSRARVKRRPMPAPARRVGRPPKGRSPQTRMCSHPTASLHTGSS